MKWLLLVLVLALPCLAAESKDNEGIPDFFLDWPGMCNMALNDEQAGLDALLLLKVDRKAAEFVARFWRHRAQAATREYQNELLEIYSRKPSASYAPEDRDPIRQELMREISLIRMGYYYDHAAEIKAMIDMRLQVAVGQAKASLKKEP